MEIEARMVYLDKIRKISGPALITFLCLSLVIFLLVISKPVFFRGVIGGVSLIGLISIFLMSKQHSFFWNQLEMSKRVERTEGKWAWLRYLMSFCVPQLIFGAPDFDTFCL
jgi:uncharacterized RDD family membrane protein YckC